MRWPHSTARVDYANALFDAVAKKQIASGDLSADIVRQFHNLKNAELARKSMTYWGTVRDTAADKAEAIEHYKKMISNSRQRPDIALGRAAFAKTCQQCHTLFGTGGKVGPELTGSNRANLDYVLANVLDSSAVGRQRVSDHDSDDHRCPRADRNCARRR